MKQAFRLVWSSLPLAFRLDPGAPGVSPSLGGLDGALSLRSLDGPSPSLKDAESDPEHGKLIGPWLVEIAASEPQAGLPAALSASTIAKHWDAALVGLLVLGIGLGLLIGWRRSPARRKGGVPLAVMGCCRRRGCTPALPMSASTIPSICGACWKPSFGLKTSVMIPIPAPESAPSRTDRGSGGAWTGASRGAGPANAP